MIKASPQKIPSDGQHYANEQSIKQVILDILKEINEPDETVAFTLAVEVTAVLKERYPGTIPDVSAVQDVIEEMFIKFNYPKAAKAYILYRASGQVWGAS